MNKKFSTLLMAGMLVTGSSFVSDLNAQVTLNGKELKLVPFTAAANQSNSGDFIIIRDCGTTAGEIDNGDYVFWATVANDGTITYRSKEIKNNSVSFQNEDAAIWTLGEAALPGGWYYSLKSKATGVFLTGELKDNTLNVVTTKNDSYTSATYVKGKKSSYFTVEETYKAAKRISAADNRLYLYLEEGDQPNGLRINREGTDANFGLVSDPNFGILLAKFEEREVSLVDELNDMQGGKGFQFQVNTAIDPADIHENVFHELDLRAFNIDGDLSASATGFQPIEWTANGHEYAIPTGIYLASDYSKLANVKDGKKALETNTISTLDQFKALTLVAADPQEYVKLAATDGDNRKKNGYGFVFRSDVTWEEMNFYATPSTDANYAATEVSEKDEVFVNNARFIVTAPNPMTENDVYTLELEGARLDLAGDGKHGTVDVCVSHISQDDYIDETDEPSRSYLLTGGKPVKVTAVPSSTIADVTELLNTDMTPAIYAVKFVSGEDVEEGEVSEYGQYLTARNENSVAVMPNVNVNDPLSQFVVSGVKDQDKNGENETIILTNRQTGSKMEAILYNEEETNVYTIYPVDGQSTELSVATTDANGDLKLENKSIKGMKVQVIKIEDVDKFATFESRDKELGLISLEFAKTEESGDRLYAAAKRNDDGTIDYTARVVTANTSDMFELVRSKEYETLTNDFIYLDGETVKTAATVADTVAFYTYKIKFFAPDAKKAYYLKGASLSETAETVVIKYNADNSVSILDADDAADVRSRSTRAYVAAIQPNGKNLTVNNEENLDKEALSYNDTYYDFESEANRAVKVFMVEEPVTGSLEAKRQAISMESGFGYLGMNENNAAVLVSEPLTLVLDTVDSDEKIPSFYISNEGKMLYYAEDSASTYKLQNWEKYSFNNGLGDRSTRLIFKEASLIDSETLQTMVDGKLVKVAEEANKVTGVEGGLNNFKYQVIESGDDDGTYVIRTQGHQYVISINTNLTLGADLAGATRFVINQEELPTANDDITVSSVKVIAGDGQITINGAAGKKVVVSNILGQVVANTVITSDNATIAAPQGIVVVAVEGEEAVKAIVK